MTSDIGAKPGSESRDGKTEMNRWPINLAAQRLLAQLKEEPAPSDLHILQLVVWALNSGNVEAELDVQETVNAMTTWRPERLKNFFQLREDHEEYEPKGWKAAATPVDLASIVLDDIEHKMIIHFPWYRSLEW